MQPEVHGVEGRAQEAALCVQHTALAAGRTGQAEAANHQAAEKTRDVGTDPALGGSYTGPGALQCQSARGGRGDRRQVPAGPGQGSSPACPYPLDWLWQSRRLVKKANRGINIPTAGLGLGETGAAGPGDKTRTNEDRVRGEGTSWWG